MNIHLFSVVFFRSNTPFPLLDSPLYAVCVYKVYNHCFSNMHNSYDDLLPPPLFIWFFFSFCIWKDSVKRQATS